MWYILSFILWSFIYLLISAAGIGSIAYCAWVLAKMSLGRFIDPLYHVKFFCCLGVILILVKISLIGIHKIDEKTYSYNQQVVEVTR